MLDKLWRVIEASKQNCNFNSERQFEKLEYILNDMDLEEATKIKRMWKQVRDEYTEDEDEFDKLHESNGGFLESEDYNFYNDFPNWLVAQGEYLYNNFSNNGISAISSYIIINNIREKDYTYENMIYAFPDIDEIEECCDESEAYYEDEYEEPKRDIDIRRDISKAVEILAVTMEEDAKIPIKILQKGIEKFL